MFYLDANVFIAAALDPSTKGEVAAKILQDAHQGKNRAATSAITFDEVFWIISKEKGREVAENVYESMLGTRNLQVIDLSREVLTESLKVLRETKLKPRDAIHVASARISGINEMVTEDADFDGITGLRCFNIKAFAKQ